MNEVLAGSRDYDDLNDEEQALIRVEWAERNEATRNGLNLAAEFAAVGRSYVELDVNGNVVRRDPATNFRDHRSSVGPRRAKRRR